MCRTQHSPPREVATHQTKKSYKKVTLFFDVFRRLNVFKNIKILSEVTTILDNVAVTAVTSFKKKDGGTPGVIFKIKTTRTWGTFSREGAHKGDTINSQ